MTSLGISWALCLITQILRFTHKRQCHPDVQNSRDSRGYSFPMDFYKFEDLFEINEEEGASCSKFPLKGTSRSLYNSNWQVYFCGSFWLCAFLSTKEGWIWNGPTTGSVTVWLVTGTKKGSDQIRSDQSLSRVRLFVIPWTAARQASLSITNSRSSLRLTSIKSVMPSRHLILCRPLLLLPTIPPSIRVFSNESTLRMRWPKYWSFSFSIIPSKE